MSEIKIQRQPTHIRKEQIKIAVPEIIYAVGPNKVSTRNLAYYVGISEGVIFKHFKNKKQIFQSIINDVQSDLMVQLE